VTLLFAREIARHRYDAQRRSRVCAVWWCDTQTEMVST